MTSRRGESTLREGRSREDEMTRVIGALTLTFVLGSAAAARAQDPSTPMDPVVVTATKTETPVGQTGASVSVITREQIEQRQVTDVLQILRDQPGLSLSQTGSRGAATSVFIRGGNNDMNLVLIDGMKVNLGGGAFDFGNITTVGIGRVEIVRGPQSALYGADAMTGVIQFFTPRGEGPFSAWVSGEGGNYATYEVQTGFSWGNKYAGVFFEYGHVSTQGILPVNNDADNDTLALRLDLSPIPELDFTFTGRYVASHVEVPTEGAGDRFDTLDPHQFENVDRLILTLGGRYRQTSWLEHRVKLGASFISDRFVDPMDLGVPTDAFSRKTTSKETRYFVDYNIALTPPKFWQITPVIVVGGSYEYQNFKQRLHPVGDPNRTDEWRETKSFYLQEQFGWMERIFLNLGGRYDDSTAYGTKLTPRVAGAAVAPVTNTRVRGAWGTGIKEPSFFEQFGGFGIPGNREIKSEQSESWEAGFDQPFWGEKIQLSATYFENRFKDLIAFVSSTEGSTNIQAAKTSGVEAVLVVRPFPGWSATANYTYLCTKVTDDGGIMGQVNFLRGEPLLRRPKRSGSVSIGYAGDRVRAVGTLYVRGESEDVDFSGGFPGTRKTRPGYDKLDLALAVVLFKNVIGLKEITWKARLQNAINERYEETFGFSSARISALTGFEVRY
jgi:vitamin B12 transporter